MTPWSWAAQKYKQGFLRENNRGIVWKEREEEQEKRKEGESVREGSGKGKMKGRGRRGRSSLMKPLHSLFR